MKLFRRFKYDLAISVAAEDKTVAEKIAEALRKKKIKYYLYTESPNWGEHVINVTVNVFGNNARYVLLITSKIYKEKYWANIEQMIARNYAGKAKPRILELKIDDTEIEGLEKYNIYMEWADNAGEIANILKKKIKTEQWNRFKKRISLSFLFLLCTSILIYWSDKVEMSFSRVKKGSNHIQRDSTKLNKIVLIPSVVFPIGTNAVQYKRQRTIRIDSFMVSATEVTVEQYRQYCQSQGAFMPPQPFGRNCINCPVVNVTWYEAMAYCKWKNGGRLPTEAEWEYAADAAAGHKYSGGNRANDFAIYNRSGPYPVGSRLPNEFELFDMSGNASEWCFDWFDSTYYSALSSPKVNPDGPKNGLEKVVRGGAYNSSIGDKTLNVLFRSREYPDQRRAYIGFRVVWNK